MPAYLLEPTPGMQCPLASDLGMNIFSASLLLVLDQVLAHFEFCNQRLTWKLLCDLAIVILAAHDLNEHGGKHRLL